MGPIINLFRKCARVDFRSRKCKSDFVHVQQCRHVFLPASENLTGKDFNFRDVQKRFCKYGKCSRNIV